LKATKNSRVILKLDFEKANDKVDYNFLEEVLHKKGFLTLGFNGSVRWLEGAEFALI